jgi:hypothetical protein
MKMETSTYRNDGKGSAAPRRRRDIFYLFSGLLSILLSILFFIIIGFYKDGQSIPSEHLIGNKASSLKALKEKGFPFSFLVIGDTQNSNRATSLIERALKEGDSSFMIILGDFVSYPDIRQHLFFLKKMTGEIKPPFPVFLVPGNHDIDYGSKIKQSERRVTPEIYESLYGPKNFDFIFNDCLFIICGIDARNQANYLNYLRDTLSKKGVGKKNIFIFMHHPPRGVGIPASFSLPNQEDFFSLLEGYKITTCFFGDYHGYWRGQRKGTNLIVSGGGGKIKSWQPQWGRFHHILRITVDENTISEGIIVIPGEVISLSGTLRKWTFIHFSPFIKDRGWILYFGVILFLSWGIYFVVCFVSFLKKRKGDEDKNFKDDKGGR